MGKDASRQDTRRVQKDGTVKWSGQRYAVGGDLAGAQVVVEPRPGQPPMARAGRHKREMTPVNAEPPPEVSQQDSGTWADPDARYALAAVIEEIAHSVGLGDMPKVALAERLSEIRIKLLNLADRSQFPRLAEGEMKKTPEEQDS